MANEPLALAIRQPDAHAAAHSLTNMPGVAARPTAALLEPIGRIEDRLSDDASAVQRLRDDLRMLLIARPEIDAPGPAVHAAKPQSWR